MNSFILCVALQVPVQGEVPPIADSSAQATIQAAGLLDPVSNVVPTTAVEARILDLVDIDGVRRNQLVGTGLVVGLRGTGDSGEAARKAVANYIRRSNLQVVAADVSSGNVALVSVTATLEPFAASGTTTDVHVHSIGESTSLFGGQLLQTPLYGADGGVYVVAQGAVSVGGFSAGGDAASVTQNHPVVGIVSGGGIIEREVPMQMVGADGFMHLHLRSPNYMTATRMAQRLNDVFPQSALAINKATIRLQVPDSHQEDVVGFISEFGQLFVSPGDEAVVVINERTGTIVAGHQVRISTAAITHGNLTISIAESPQVSQPQPFSDGETTVVPRTDLDVQVEDRGLMVVPGGASVSELATALNRLGVSSRDLISIFQALKRGGQLHARLEVL